MKSTLTLHATGERFDMPRGWSPEVVVTSPIWGDYGSHTLPIELPMTPHNSRLLGWPADGTASTKPHLRQRVSLVVGGGKQRVGTLMLHDSQGSASVGFDEGEAYERMRSLKLNELPDLPVRYCHQYFVREDLDTILWLEGAEAWYRWMWDLWRGAKEEEELLLFPVLIAKEEHEGKRYYTVLNRPAELPADLRQNRALLGAQAYTLTTLEGGKPTQVSYPPLYGIAPMVRLGVALRLALRAVGYELERNALDTDPTLNRVALLHNCMDALVKQELHYADLMPDCTINDLIETVRCRFGGVLYFDSTLGVASLELMEQTLSKGATAPLTPAEVGQKFGREFPPFGCIHLSADRLEDCEAPDEQYEALLKRCDGLQREVENQYAFDPITRWHNVKHRSTGRHYRAKLVPRAGLRAEYELLSSPCFDYLRTTPELEPLELTSPDKQVATYMELPLQQPLSGGWGSGSIWEHLPMPFYSVGGRHHYTTYRSSGDEGAERATERPLALALYHGRGVLYDGAPLGLWYGSTQSWDNAGSSKRFSHGLNFHGGDGLFVHYFRRWDALLRHAARPVRMELDPQTAERVQWRANEPLVIGGAAYLLEELQAGGGEVAEVTLRSLDLQLPYDLEAEQAPPTPSEQLWVWEFFNNREEAVAERSKDSAILGKFKRYEVLEEVVPHEADFGALAPPDSSSKSIELTYRLKGNWHFDIGYQTYTIHYTAGIRARRI